MTIKKTRRSAPQARGLARRAQLLDSARQMLVDKDVDEINIADVAASAGVPKSSAYHFYPHINALYSELAGLLAYELKITITAPIPNTNDWRDIFRILLNRGVEFLRRDRAALRLLLGPKTPLEIKRSDRKRDREIALSVVSLIATQFVLPEFFERDEKFFRAIEIADLFFSLSVLEEGEITEHLAGEAINAALSYLQLYIPIMLPRNELSNRPDTLLSCQ